MSERDEIEKAVRELLPSAWFREASVEVDRDEILILGELAPVADQPDETCIAAFREDTRDHRVALARQLERRWSRSVSWGAECGSVRQLFTTASVPAMTRLRLPERQVLDTLIDAGVARSRSDALGWCVRLVAANEEEWLAGLRKAFAAVEQARDRGPAGNAPS